MKTTGRILLVVFLCILAAGMVAEAKQPENNVHYSGAVRAYFDTLYPIQKGDDYPILYDAKDSPWLEDQVPGAELVQAYAKFRMPAITATFIFFEGRAYAMPDEFNDFIRDAGVHVKDEDEALGLADLYVKAWEPSGSYGIPAAVVLMSAEEIPHRGKSVPKSVEKDVVPPGISRKGEAFEVSLQSWCGMGGWVRDWKLAIGPKGETKGNNKLIGKYVGDAIVEGAIPEHFAPGASGPVILAEPPESTRDVDVNADGTPEFVIHWRVDDFINPDRDGTPTEVADMVEFGARRAWQELVVTNGFDAPGDKTIDIYIWNNSVTYGPLSAPPGFGPFYNSIGGDQYIYDINNLVLWAGPGMRIYWPDANLAHTSTTGHELFHAIQRGYKFLGCIAWMDEGSARFIESVMIPEGQFWQNSPLAGLPPGSYQQDANHGSSYIQQSMGYILYPGSTLVNTSYSGCTYWRYVYEHRGLSGLKAIYDRVKTDGCGSTFGEEITRINTALGTTDIGFTEFATANYLEFSPYPFARDDEFYQQSTLYYRDVSRQNIPLTTGSAFPLVRAGSLKEYATEYFDIDPGNVKRLGISFDGDAAASFAVKAFRVLGSGVTEVPVPLDANMDGSITVLGADALDATGLMVARIETSGAGGLTVRPYTVTLEKVNTPPVANANGPYSAPEGTAFELDASGSTDADGDTLEYRWDVNGDGTFEIPWTADAQVSYTACDNFAWTAKLEVRDWDATSSATAAITTSNENPTAYAGADKTAKEGDVISFTGTASDAGSCDTLSYSWDFGDGTPAVEGTLTPTHTYCNNDVYTVTLTVRDDDRGSATDTLAVTVENVPPVAEAGPDQTVPEGTPVSFSGTISDAGTCDILTYSWDFGDGSPPVTDTLTPAHAYGDNGSYTVTLTVSDGEEEGSDSLTVTVTNVDPTVMKGAMDQTNPQFILPKVHTLTFHGTFSDPGWLDTHTALWNFGDGSTDPGILAEENNQPDATGTVTATHAYQAPGDYLVTVTVTDDDGGAGTSEAWAIHVADVVEAKHDLANYIQGLGPNAFKGNEEQRKAALANKIAALDDMITRQEWNGFITSIVSDVRSKADGQIDGKANDDWIKEDVAQSHICMKIDDIVAYVKTFM